MFVLEKFIAQPGSIDLTDIGKSHRHSLAEYYQFPLKADERKIEIKRVGVTSHS